MKKIMYNYVVCVLVMVIMFCEISQANMMREDVYYRNDKGLVLSEIEYFTAIKYIDADDLIIFNQSEFDYIMSDTEHNIGESTTLYSIDKYKYCNGENVFVGEETLTEEEFLTRETENVKKSGAAETKEEVTYSTAMKKITLQAYYTSGNTVRTALTCKWLSIPVTKSYDIIALRFVNFSYITDTNETDNLEGYQFYDGKQIHYNHSNGNFKKCSKGVGLSVNIVDSVSTSLSVKLIANVYSSTSVFTAYGTYQHSVDDISLNTSKRYDIVSENGVGDVLKFKWGAGSHYDNMAGLRITERFGD